MKMSGREFFEQDKVPMYTKLLIVGILGDHTDGKASYNREREKQYNP